MKEDARKKASMKYTEEFKQNALSLVEKLGVSETARKLGIPLSSLNGWKAKASGKSPRSNDIIRLQRENKKLKKAIDERDVIIDMLRKTTAYFSREMLK